MAEATPVPSPERTTPKPNGQIVLPSLSMSDLLTTIGDQHVTIKRFEMLVREMSKENATLRGELDDLRHVPIVPPA